MLLLLALLGCKDACEDGELADDAPDHECGTSYSDEDYETCMDIQALRKERLSDEEWADTLDECESDDNDIEKAERALDCDAYIETLNAL